MTRDLMEGDEVMAEIPAVIAADGTITTTSTLRLDADTVHAAGGRVVLTRGIDHPSHDLPGTVRAGGWVKIESRVGTWWNIFNGGEELDGDDVQMHPRIGVMPGTPAAEALGETVTGTGIRVGRHHRPCG